LLTDAALQHTFRPTPEQGPKPANQGQSKPR
jgi:hypothetical protein